MAEPSSDTTPLAIARLEGTVSRVEAKIDVQLTDMARRIADSEADRRELHGRITKHGEHLSNHESRLQYLDSRVGGAFSKYVPPVIAGLALVVSTIIAMVRL